jgi:hypothetical protein
MWEILTSRQASYSPSIVNFVPPSGDVIIRYFPKYDVGNIPSPYVTCGEQDIDSEKTCKGNFPLKIFVDGRKGANDVINILFITPLL